MLKKLFSYIIVSFLLVGNAFSAGLNENTKLLLHLNGTDGATSTTDASDSNHSITFNGTAQLDTAFKKWGTASLLLDGDSDYLSIADSTDWDIVGSSIDSWTVDVHIKLDTPNTAGVAILTQGDTSTDCMRFLHHSSLGLNFLVKVSDTFIINPGWGGLIEDSNWHHVALIKVGSKYACYLDGNQVNYVDDSSTATYAKPLWIGVDVSENYFNGHIDEFRVQHSNYFSASPNANNTDTITVPAEEYSRISGQIMRLQLN